MIDTARTYSHTKNRYVIETCYGCYSDYGWTIAHQGSDDIDLAITIQKRFGSDYRVIDNSTGEIITTPI